MRTAIVLLGLLVTANAAGAQSRVEKVRARGHLVCGISAGVAGFAQATGPGQYTGFDIDICRAVAAAVTGHADRVQFRPAPSIEEFLKSPDIDIVSRRLTWTLEREGAFPVRFAPVVFYDGQGFLASARLRAQSVRDLAGARVCVEPGTIQERRLEAYFRTSNLRLNKQLTKPGADVRSMLESRQCDAYSADVSELAALRATMANRESVTLLRDQISKEPLAPLVRSDDPQFFNIVRWTVMILIAGEELGVSSRNLVEAQKSDVPEVKQLLGVIPGIGQALGLDDQWAQRVIREVGNYGEMFDRHLGAASAVKLDRGLNRLWSDGGLLYTPPLR